MDVFVKSRVTYRTIKKAVAIASNLTLDSLEGDTSAVTVVGTGIGRDNTGDWLIADGQVYQIVKVKPNPDRTVLTLGSALDAFNRPIEPEDQEGYSSIGAFVERTLLENWVQCSDPAYSMPYLLVSNLDTTPYTSPELGSNGCFSLPDYCRLARKSYRTVVRFSDAGSSLVCTISRVPAESRQVSFEDGRSQLVSVDYSRSGVAKLTVLCDVDTGEKDAAGEAILIRERSTWYLAEDGTISQTIPARRASGEWSTIAVKGRDKVESKVIETFAKNKANHKLEFWSSLDLAVHDNCTFLVYGELLRSHISYKRKGSEDKRFYYKSGELATTATEKLRGVVT